MYEFDKLMATQREPAGHPTGSLYEKRRCLTRGGRCAERFSGGILAACAILCGALENRHRASPACPDSAAANFTEKRAFT